jgi:hypothetical protein
MTVHTHHLVKCDLCPASVTVLQGQPNDVALRGWLIVNVEPLASHGTVRCHVCPTCAAASKALTKLVEPLGPMPVASKELLS